MKRFNYKKVLVALGLSAAFIAPAALAPPAIASHGYDTLESASCGMSGGSGTVRTTFYIDYSQSLASFRPDRVKVENLTNRNISVDMFFRSDFDSYYPQLNNLVLPPGSYYNDTFFHDTWFETIPELQYVRAEYYWGTHRTVHDIFPDWPPSNECYHFTNLPDND